MASTGQVLGVAAFAGASFGTAGWSIDQLRRNDWNPRIILDGHAPLGASLPVGLAAGAVGIAGAAVLAPRMSSALATHVVRTGFQVGIAGAAVGAAIGTITMLASSQIPDDRRSDPKLWAQQVLGWAAPAFVTGAAAGAVFGLFASHEGRMLLKLAR